MSTVSEQPDLGVKKEAGSECPVTVTSKAIAEVKRIVEQQKADGVAENLYLRLRVVGGGCSGFQHKLDLDPQVTEIDETWDIDGMSVVIDKRSKIYLTGATVDFHDDLNRRGFSVGNPSAKSTCGCGSSFSM